MHACTHLLEESIQNAVWLQAARVGSCVDPSARRSEINYGVSGGTRNPGVSWQRLRHLVRGLPLCRGPTGPRSHMRLALRPKRMNCEGVELSRLGMVWGPGGSAAAGRSLINHVTSRVLAVTIAVYSYDYGYGRGYRYTFAESTPRYYTDPGARSCIRQKYDGQWAILSSLRLSWQFVRKSLYDRPSLSLSSSLDWIECYRSSLRAG